MMSSAMSTSPCQPYLRQKYYRPASLPLYRAACLPTYPTTNRYCPQAQIFSRSLSRWVCGCLLKDTDRVQHSSKILWWREGGPRGSNRSKEWTEEKAVGYSNDATGKYKLPMLAVTSEHVFITRENSCPINKEHGKIL